MDGNSFQLDVFVERLRRDLPTLAEATTSSRAAEGRRRVGLGLADIIGRYRGSLYDRHPEEWVPILRARRSAISVPPHFLETPKAPRLQDRLFITADLLTAWHFGEVAPEVLLEEIHTAAELLLTGWVGSRRNDLSFKDLVQRAATAGILRFPFLFPADWPEVRDVGPDQLKRLSTERARELLLSMKDQRKHSKHRGAAGAQEWLDQHFWHVVGVLEYLAPHARDV
jgi:hypothetical protein